MNGLIDKLKRKDHTMSDIRSEIERVTTRCTAHGEWVCTICNPVPFVTPKNDKYFEMYREYYAKHGRECTLNHKEMKEVRTLLSMGERPHTSLIKGIGA